MAEGRDPRTIDLSILCFDAAEETLYTHLLSSQGLAPRAGWMPVIYSVLLKFNDLYNKTFYQDDARQHILEHFPSLDAQRDFLDKLIILSLKGRLNPLFLNDILQKRRCIYDDTIVVRPPDRKEGEADYQDDDFVSAPSPKRVDDDGDYIPPPPPTTAAYGFLAEPANNTVTMPVASAPPYAPPKNSGSEGLKDHKSGARIVVQKPTPANLAVASASASAPATTRAAAASESLSAASASVSAASASANAVATPNIPAPRSVPPVNPGKAVGMFAAELAKTQVVEPAAAAPEILLPVVAAAAELSQEAKLVLAKKEAKLAKLKATPPSQIVCQISFEVMKEPVFLSSCGKTVDKRSLLDVKGKPGYKMCPFNDVELAPETEKENPTRLVVSTDVIVARDEYHAKCTALEKEIDALRNPVRASAASALAMTAPAA